MARFVTGLDIGSRCVKLVRIGKASGARTVVARLMESFSSLAPEVPQMLDAIKKVIEEAGSSADPFRLCVSGRGTATVLFQTGGISRRELRQLAEWHLEQHLSFSATRTECGHEILTKLDGGGLLVAAAGAQKSAVLGLVRLARQAGARPTFLETGPLALARCITSSILGEGASAVVDLGASALTFLAVSGGLPRFCRQVSLGLDLITTSLADFWAVSWDEADARKVKGGGLIQRSGESLCILAPARSLLEEVLVEVGRSIRHCESRMKDEVRRIVLTGGGACIPQVDDVFTQVLGRPAQVFDPFMSFDAASGAVDDGSGPAFAVATGLAMGGLPA